MNLCCLQWIISEFFEKPFGGGGEEKKRRRNVPEVKNTAVLRGDAHGVQERVSCLVAEGIPNGGSARRIAGIERVSQTLYKER